MAVWENDELLKGMPDYIEDFARIWRAADTVVYSASIDNISASRTRQEASLSAEGVRAMKASLERDLTIARPNLAAQAFQAGVVDECRVFVAPIAVGGGNSAMPRGIAVELELAEERRFGSGLYTCGTTDGPDLLCRRGRGAWLLAAR